jgi:hypothetical protein
MIVIRRLYLYAVTFVSLLVVLWGVIGLLRSVFAGAEIGGVSRLAGALSLILVGVPVFLIHWTLAQRLALKDAEERSARLRAIFLYGSLLALLVPAVQNFLALLDRAFLVALGQPAFRAMVGGGQSLSDNLVAIFLNVAVAAYFYTVLRADWRAAPLGDGYPDTRRLYRYLWMLYGLAMLVFGVQQVVGYLLESWQSAGVGMQQLLANGLALLVIGVLLWVFAWGRIQRSLIEPAEAQSLLRLVVLYILTFIGMGVTLVSAGFGLDALLRLVFADISQVISGLAGLLGEFSMSLSLAIPFGFLWVYFGRILAAEMNALPDEPRRAELKRLYDYILSLAGLVATFVGLQMLIAFLLDVLLSQQVVWGSALRRNLAAALSTLVIGLPLWILAWRPTLREAAAEGEAGDRARRSMVRKGYLFLVLFASVLGIMFSAGVLLFQLLSAALGEPPQDLLLTSARMLALVLLFALALAYHWGALRGDNRIAERSLARRHAQFPVLVLAPDEGDFARIVVNALERDVAELPVAVHSYSQGAPNETLSAARAVILPSELLARPSEAMRVWLGGFEGARLVVPTPAVGWHWLLSGGRPSNDLARQAARLVRQLAEGEEIPQPRGASAWLVVVYILAGLFALEILMVLISLIVSLLQNAAV